MTLPSTGELPLPRGRATYLRAARPGGRPVMLLHGGGIDRATLSWRYLFPALAERRTVVAPNWPGCGGSAPFGRPYTIPDLGRWLMDLMDQLAIEKADMVGVSMGGGAALWTALRHPDRVGRLVPVGTYGIQRHAPYHPFSYLAARLPLNAVSYAVLRKSRRATHRALAAIFADRGKVTDDIVDEVRDVLTDGATASSFTGFQRGEIGPRRLRTVLAPELAKIGQPTLFIHGRADTLVPLGDVEAAAAAMPRAQVRVMEAGHWPMRECPAAFNTIVEGFLDPGDELPGPLPARNELESHGNVGPGP